MRNYQTLDHRPKIHRSDPMAGFFVYIAIFGMTFIWIIGWMTLAMVIGSLFRLPIKTTCLLGALLGPLGFMVTIVVGFLENNQKSNLYIGNEVVGLMPSHTESDPFQ